jgi:hypothetical protein
LSAYAREYSPPASPPNERSSPPTAYNTPLSYVPQFRSYNQPQRTQQWPQPIFA